MDKLTRELVRDLLPEETTKIKKVVGIYGGRYQPFGPHHLKTYKWLKSKVDDAYITTSDIKKPPKHHKNNKQQKPEHGRLEDCQKERNNGNEQSKAEKYIK